MKKANELNVKGTPVRVMRVGDEDFVCLTDIAATRNPTDPRFVVQSWMRNRMTVLFLGLWEELNNPEFNRVGFEAVREKFRRIKWTFPEIPDWLMRWLQFSFFIYAAHFIFINLTTRMLQCVAFPILVQYFLKIIIGISASLALAIILKRFIPQAYFRLTGGR